MAQYFYTDAGGQYYDFMHYLFSVGTKIHVRAALSGGSGTEVYSVPSGKKAYIIWMYQGDYYIDTYGSGVISIRDASDTVQLSMEFARGDGTHTGAWQPQGYCMIELDEGWDIYVNCVNDYVRASFFIIEVDK